MNVLRTDKDGNIVSQTGQIIQTKQQFLKQKVLGQNNANKKTTQQSKPLTLEQRIGGNVVSQPKINTTKDKQYTTFKYEPTKYQVTKDSVFVIKFGIDFYDQRLIVINEYQVDDYPESQSHWVKFRMWTYKQQINWKDECMRFNNESRSFIIDNNKLNQLKVRRLIKDWSFAEHSDKFKLLHTNGVLSDQSYQIFKGFYPNVINAIIERMNRILQYNG